MSTYEQAMAHVLYGMRLSDGSFLIVHDHERQARELLEHSARRKLIDTAAAWPEMGAE